MADIHLDLGLLDALSAEIRKITQEFGEAKSIRPDLKEAVGDYRGCQQDGLQDAVDGFSKGWDIRRKHLLEALTATGDALNAIHDTFLELDTTLASALRQEA